MALSQKKEIIPIILPPAMVFHHMIPKRRSNHDEHRKNKRNVRFGAAAVVNKLGLNNGFTLLTFKKEMFL